MASLRYIPVFWKLSSAFVVVITLVLLGHQYAWNRAPEHQGWVTAAAILAAVLLCCAATWLLVRRYIRRPVRNLVDGMNRLAEKDFDVRLEEGERDELGDLAASFNDMAGMLQASLHELKKTRDYLQGILESSADIIITVNPAGNIQTINRGAERALGYDRFDLIGTPAEVLFADPRDREVALERLKHTEDVINYETRFVTRDGEIRDVLLTVSRLRNPDGDIIGRIGIGKDITEEKRLQKKLRQAQRFADIGQVFTSIQHSLKNMLNACKGGAYMVKTGLAKDNRKMLVEGWDDCLPEDLKQYGEKLRKVAEKSDEEDNVRVSRVGVINTIINGILDLTMRS